MAWMFVVADNFNQSLAQWDVSSVTDMSGMFGENAYIYATGGEKTKYYMSSWNIHGNWGETVRQGVIYDWNNNRLLLAIHRPLPHVPFQSPLECVQCDRYDVLLIA